MILAGSQLGQCHGESNKKLCRQNTRKPHAKKTTIRIRKTVKLLNSQLGKFKEKPHCSVPDCKRRPNRSTIYQNGHDKSSYIWNESSNI